jgi:hypothetical protein
MAIRDDLSGHPHVLGPTPFFAPSTVPGDVWLFRARSGTQNEAQAWQAPISGGASSPPITLPAEANLPVIRGTDAGLLLPVAQHLALWNPGSKPRPLPYAPAGGVAEGIDATSRLVAYGSGCTAPPGTAGWVPTGFNLVNAISPGGRVIAAYAATRPQGQGAVRLYLVPISGPGGHLRAVPSSVADLFARTAWSANGSWLLYQGPGSRLWAYQVSNGKTSASSTPCCQYTAMVAVPGDSG